MTNNSIWFREYTIPELQESQEVNMAAHLGIRITEIGSDFLKGTMPVDERTQQPFGVLHGGASVVLAETIGSIGANLVVDPARNYCVGLDINANHLRSVRTGEVTAIAKPLHIGAITQVWEIKITDFREKLVCAARLTMAVLKKV